MAFFSHVCNAIGFSILGKEDDMNEQIEKSLGHIRRFVLDVQKTIILSAIKSEDILSNKLIIEILQIRDCEVDVYNTPLATRIEKYSKIIDKKIIPAIYKNIKTR